MAESCSSFPTLTSTREIRTESIVTTTSTIISTIPASAFNITTTIPCSNTSCPSTVLLTEVLAHAFTTQIPVTLTAQIDTFFVSTLWGSTCVRPNTSPSPILPISTPTTSSSSTISSSAPPSVSRSPATSSSVAISTRPDGIVTSNIIVVTAAPAPPEQTSASSTNSSGDRSKLGPIVGGAIGGAVFLGILALTAWYFFDTHHDVDFQTTTTTTRKKQTVDPGLDDLDFFEKDDPPLNTKTAYHDHNSTGPHNSFGHQQQGVSQQPQHVQQYQAQSQYHGTFDGQAQYHPYTDQTQGFQPDSQHFQHHYDPQQAQQPQQYLSSDQTQGLDPASSQQQYADPQMTQQQVNTHDWQTQGQPEYGSNNAIGGETPLKGTHGVTDPFIPVPIIGGIRRDSAGYSQDPGQSSRHHPPSAIQYPSHPTSNAYNSGPLAQIPSTAVRQQSFYVGSYMPVGQGPVPGFVSEAHGAYDGYTDGPSR